ncbi:MAG: hypothetical protein CMF23_14495 [Ignavibacteriae bacterium]|nr:hypothetical protein [Ignavibacteriota bacterium]
MNAPITLQKVQKELLEMQEELLLDMQLVNPSAEMKKSEALLLRKMENCLMEIQELMLLVVKLTYLHSSIMSIIKNDLLGDHRTEQQKVDYLEDAWNTIDENQD